MTLQEFLFRVLYALEDMVPLLITGVGATAVAVLILHWCSKDVWIRHKRFALVTLLFGIPGKGRFRLGCIWLKFVFVCYFLVSFQPMSTLHYWSFIVPSLLAAFLDEGFVKWIQGMFWLGIQLLGLFSANMICRFIRDMAGGPVFIFIYIAIGLFLLLLSLYLFLNELLSLSDHRDVDPQNVWGQEPEE